MSESLLSSSDESLNLSNTENQNQTYLSYSLLFDKIKQNFSTSSEKNLSSINQNQTIKDQEESTKFNPFLLLFEPDIEQISNDVIDTKKLHDDESNVYLDGQCVSPEKSLVSCEQPQNKRNSLKNRRKNSISDDDDQAFEKFLQEHRTRKSVQLDDDDKENVEAKPTGRPRRKNRNSLKDFIRDSSSSDDEEEEQDPSEFYPKINRLIDKDPLWTKLDEYESDDDNYASDESTDSSSLSSKEDHRSITITKKNDRKIEVTFLESLSDYVPIENKHSDVKQYFLRTGFKNKKKRQELAEKLFSMYDKDVFSCQLSNKATVTWSARLTSTAGHCTTRRSAQTATITLSHKVCDTPERCRDTLLHEMCHAAVSLIDGVLNEGHGPLWKKWTRKAERVYPYLPAISVKHTYDINYKFIYRCIQCQYEVHRHSKSLNIDIDLCGKCLGKFQLLLNNKTTDVQTPKKTLTKYNLFIKEHFQRIKQEQPHLSTPQLMKHLSQEYKKKTQPNNQIDLIDFEQLKI